MLTKSILPVCQCFTFESKLSKMSDKYKDITDRSDNECQQSDNERPVHKIPKCMTEVVINLSESEDQSMPSTSKTTGHYIKPLKRNVRYMSSIDRCSL